jgi:SulP family sulfate permease
MRSVGAMDATAMHNLETLYEDCKKKGIQIVMSHVNEQPLQVIHKSGFDALIGKENFCPHIDDALKRAETIASETK